MARLDPHSYNDSTQPEVALLDWKATVDFASRRLSCLAGLELRSPGEGPLDLDTRSLEIQEVFDAKGLPLPFELSAPDAVLGSRLRVTLPPGTQKLSVRYQTVPEASALQWLSPAQTFGGEKPFLFSQCQAIHARSIVPLQDTPRLRIRFRAELTVPSGLKAVMAAAAVDSRVEGALRVERFEMPQPIPSYLLAFAVGELESRELGPRSRVWAEPGQVEAAAWEFAGVDAMLLAAESLFGPYDWDRFDILTMPPSFPYGGMENPRLTFLTPTLLAKDRSLVNVVAHELAHSWTGNLVTNASAEHFWLNEGFTVFAERRILEVLEGPEVCALHAALGRRSLDLAVAQFSAHPELTRLRTSLEGVDPDEAFSVVPYEKGYLLLRALEEVVGRKAFDTFVRRYVGTFRFQSITTEQFVDFLKKELPTALGKVDLEIWLHATGIPEDAPAPSSGRLEALNQLVPNAPVQAEAERWTPTEWQLYLESLPVPQSLEALAGLDERFKLTGKENYEVLVSWLTLAARSGHAATLPRTEEVLGKVGRMKYLKPLYLALLQVPETRARARAVFEKAKDSYHPIARVVVEGLLTKHGA